MKEVMFAAPPSRTIAALCVAVIFLLFITSCDDSSPLSNKTKLTDVDLSKEGTLDWVHWGRERVESLNRKAGVTPQISNYKKLAGHPPKRFANARTAFSWQGGAPAATEEGTATGIYFYGVGNGYELTLPADPTTREVRLYVGCFKARGRLTATVSDGSAPPYEVTIDNPDGFLDRVVSLDYAAASADQTLLVHYQLMDDYGLSGNITLQAVTLQAVAGPPALLSYDFDNGSDEGWSAPVDDSGNPSAWSVEGGVMRQKNYVEGRSTGHPFVESYHLGSYRYLLGLTESDYRFSVDIAPLPNNPNELDGNDVGLLFRYQDPDNYYRLTFNARYGFTRLEKRVGGQFTTLAVDGRGYIDGERTRVTVVALGALIQIYVDQGADGLEIEPRFALHDTSLMQGSVGLYAQDNAAFDNVVISAVEAEPPAIVLAAPLSYSILTGGDLIPSAVTIPADSGATVDFYVDGRRCNGTPVTSVDGLYSANCGIPGSGDHTVEALLTQNGNSYSDINGEVGSGNYFLAIGDSITNGRGDRYGRDNGISANGRIVSSQGYEGTLSDLLAASAYPSHIIFNEGVGGDTLGDVLGRINSIIARHPGANHALLLLGTNDSAGSGALPSGLGCNGQGCVGTYKGGMQQLVDGMKAAGMNVTVALLPPAFGTNTTAFSDPLGASRNRLIKEYNQVISNEVASLQAGPDLFDLFYDDQGTPADKSDDDARCNLFDDLIHPNGLGYRLIAQAWADALTGSAGNPFFLRNLCNRTISANCAGPLRTQHKQNLLQVGDRYYIDRDYTLTTIPSMVEQGIWLMTADAEASRAAADYIEFLVDRTVTLYVAYDAGAAALPSWLDPASSSFVDTGYQVETSNPTTPILNLYSRSQGAGVVTLGSNGAAGAVGADSNYLVIAVPH